MKLLLVMYLLSTLVAHAKLINESEVSTVQTTGNTNVETYLFKTLSKYALRKDAYTFGGHYNYGESKNELQARDWDFNFKYEHEITDRLSYYLGEVIEGYKFQGIKARYNSDAGLRYYFLKTDPRNFFAELGYRYTIEDRYVTDTRYENKGRAYLEWNDKPSEKFQYRFWVEYLPNFTDHNDYLLIYEGSITAIITSILGLKVAYKNIHDSVPAIAGNRHNDSLFTTALVAKF